ncbi:MAG TPA: hypothetical protein VJ742_12665 [Nitrososphaera sp.]|nr:hypothetical protein [Nitrososphaera sp.]
MTGYVSCTYRAAGEGEPALLPLEFDSKAQELGGKELGSGGWVGSGERDADWYNFPTLKATLDFALYLAEEMEKLDLTIVILEIRFPDEDEAEAEKTEHKRVRCEDFPSGMCKCHVNVAAGMYLFKFPPGTTTREAHDDLEDVVPFVKNDTAYAYWLTKEAPKRDAGDVYGLGPVVENWDDHLQAGHKIEFARQR